MIKCENCNKVIKGRGKWLRTCKKCGIPVCPSCRTQGYCVTCHPANQDTKLIYEYFLDKYAEKEIKKVLT